MARKLLNIYLVASFELRSALRSRRAIALILLYLLGALLGTYAFLKALQSAQGMVPAGTAAQLTRDERTLALLASLTGSEEIARALLGLQPITLFYGWLALNATPLLVTLTAYDAIAQERESGSARYTLIRCSKLHWSVGKYLGQAALLAAGLAAGGMASLLVAFTMSDELPLVETGLWIARFSTRAWCYGFAYLGLTLLASQLMRTVNGARGVAVLLLGLVSLGGRLLVSLVSIKTVSGGQLLERVFPWSYQLNLWHPQLDVRLPAIAGLLLLGVFYFSVGFISSRRQDA